MIPLLVVFPILNNDRTQCYGNIVVAYTDTKDVNTVKVNVKVLDETNTLFIE